MDDVTKRVNYFDRQFLRAADFQDETAYEMDRRRRHNRLLHASGVAEGLTVAGNVGDTFVTVAPGTAYDDLGQEIVLPQRQQPWQVNVPGGTSPVYLTITYFEQPSDPSSDPGVIGNTRVAEIPTLAVSATLPPDPDPNHALLLAAISLDNNQKISAVDTNPPGRRRAGGLPPKSVGTNELADGSVTTSKIADGAVTQPKLADAAVIASKIADSAVTQTKLLDESVATSKIAKLAVTQDRIAPNSVSMNELKASVVVQGTQIIEANNTRIVPASFIPFPQKPGFYIPNITITTQAPKGAILAVSWEDEYWATTDANNTPIAGRMWRITNQSQPQANLTVSYTIHKLEES
jgi:hypothetical protein